MPHTSFGIMTAPQQVAYADVLRVWREADAIPQIEHAWLFDHLMPIAGDPAGPAFEGWTLLSALAAQTRRLRVGLLVTSNRFRPPAMLAKIAATVDVVSGGRSAATLRIAAEHADVWNFPGADLSDATARGALLDRYCAEIGRDPVARSIVLSADYDRPAATRDAIARSVDAGFRHVVLALGAPYPDGVAGWVADELARDPVAA